MGQKFEITPGDRRILSVRSVWLGYFPLICNVLLSWYSLDHAYS